MKSQRKPSLGTPTVGAHAGSRRSAAFRKGRVPTPTEFAEEGMELLTSSPGVSLASLTRLQESVKGLVTSVTSGRSSGESLAKLNPDGLWLKTYQGFSRPMLDGSLEPFSLTWPRWGTLLAGVLSGLSTWERGTDGIESSLWPTARTRGLLGGSGSREMVQTLVENGKLSEQEATDMLGVKLFPTPQSRDWKGQSHRGQYAPGDCLPNAVMFPTPSANNSTGQGEHGEGGPNLQTVVSGQLNPTWVEWLMGFPEGWTDLER